MIPQGSAVFSAARIESLTARINAIQVDVDLQPLVDEAMEPLIALKAGMLAEMAKLAPILALLTAPGADLSKLATWVSDYIASVLAPQYLPYMHYVEQLAEMATAVTGLVSAIENKASTLEVTVTIPTF